MAWVRYDDQFHNNKKINAILMDDPAAIALHAMARTWTNTQPHPGYIPEYMPGSLVRDKRKGAKWAAVLLRHGVFHPRNDACPSCEKRIAEDGWPPHEDGYVFHDWWRYNAPERDRATPGTPADISAKRRESGRTGGLKSAARREQARREAQANDFGDEPNEANRQANGVSKTAGLLASNVTNDSKPSSNGVTPVPVVTPNGATTGPVPVPPTAAFASNDEANAGIESVPGVALGALGDSVDTAQTILAAYCDWCEVRPPRQVRGQLAKLIKGMLDEGIGADDIKRGMAEWRARDVHPSVLPSVVNNLMNGHGRGGVNGHPLGARQAETDRLFEGAWERAVEREQAQAAAGAAGAGGGAA